MSRTNEDLLYSLERLEALHYTDSDDIIPSLCNKAINVICNQNDEIERLRAEAASIREQTAQACAEIVDSWSECSTDDSASIVAEKIADLIRDRFKL